MPTLAALKSQIAGDLHRSDLSAQISLAISAAVRHFGRKDLWFLEQRAMTSASASQAWYAVPTDFNNGDTMLITLSGSKTPLIRASYQEIDEKDDGTTYGAPAEYCIYQDQFRLYPVPDTGYELGLSYRAHLSVPESDSASNAWSNVAFDLIRFRAEWDVCKHYLHDPERAAEARTSEAEAFASILGESVDKVATGRIKRSGW